MPKPLVGTRPGGVVLPRRLTPIFRDRDELASAPDLSMKIKDALRRSRVLLVVCSPNAAQSSYVNEEIVWFKSLGRSQRVITLIVSGEPGAGPLWTNCGSASISGESRMRSEQQRRWLQQ